MIESEEQRKQRIATRELMKDRYGENTTIDTTEKMINKRYFYVSYLRKDGAGFATITTENGRMFNMLELQKSVAIKNNCIANDVIVMSWQELTNDELKELNDE